MNSVIKNILDYFTFRGVVFVKDYNVIKYMKELKKQGKYEVIIRKQSKDWVEKLENGN
jgi:hypothetical protein